MSDKNLKTGEKADTAGFYSYDGPADGKIVCNPTPEEKVIPLDKGDTAPPVKSCPAGAKWKLVKRR